MRSVTLRYSAFFLLTVGVCVLVSAAIGGSEGLLIGLVLSLLLVLPACLKNSALSKTTQQEANVTDSQRYEQIMRELCAKAQIPLPRFRISHEPTPTAWVALDAEGYTVWITEGLIRIMTRNEVRAVLAHEIAHIRNNDHRHFWNAGALCTAAGLAANIAMFCKPASLAFKSSPFRYVLTSIVLLFSSACAAITQFAVFRRREFKADASAVQLIESAQPLIQALERLREHCAQEPSRRRLVSLANIVSTHPSLNQRICRLSSMRESKPDNIALCLRFGRTLPGG